MVRAPSRTAAAGRGGKVDDATATALAAREQAPRGYAGAHGTHWQPELHADGGRDKEPAPAGALPAAGRGWSADRQQQTERRTRAKTAVAHPCAAIVRADAAPAAPAGSAGADTALVEPEACTSSPVVRKRLVRADPALIQRARAASARRSAATSMRASGRGAWPGSPLASTSPPARSPRGVKSVESAMTGVASVRSPLMPGGRSTRFAPAAVPPSPAGARSREPTAPGMGFATFTRAAAGRGVVAADESYFRES